MKDSGFGVLTAFRIWSFECLGLGFRLQGFVFFFGGGGGCSIVVSGAMAYIQADMEAVC